MGAAAAQFADHIILTTDNPRSEDPAVIIEAIKAGIAPEHHAKVVCELDREEAIRKAYALSGPGSIIALLGKGPINISTSKRQNFPSAKKLSWQTFKTL